MTEISEIKNEIIRHFPSFNEEDIRIDVNRIWVSVVLPERFSQLIDFTYNQLKFNNFHMTAGLDCKDHFEVVYIMTNADNTMLNLRQRTVSREDTSIMSVFDYFENSVFHERELEDLFGLKVEGLPPGHHYPLPDKWPDGNYPLRKDWNTEFFDKKNLTYDKEAADAAQSMAIEEEKRKQAAKEVAIAAAMARKATKEAEEKHE